MYPSDYGYSVLANSCERTTDLGSYSTASCAGQSWLYGEGNEWTITPGTGSADVNFLSSFGNMSNYFYYENDGAANSKLVRPVLYLASSVYVLDGSGTQSDPYIIGI